MNKKKVFKINKSHNAMEMFWCCQQTNLYNQKSLCNNQFDFDNYSDYPRSKEQIACK